MKNINIIFSVFLITLLSNCSNPDNDTKGIQDDNIETHETDSIDLVHVPFVSPPCPEVSIPYESFSVIAEKGGEFNYTSGSKVKFKPNSFVDETGKLIEGDITILYREFHNPLDFFIAGIPMNYDTSESISYFESAGMLEILAFKEGKPVFVKDESPIIVEMKSDYEGSDYNVYYLDTVARNWQFIGKDSILMADNKLPVQPANSYYSDSGEKIEKPIEPQKANKQKHRFNIQVDLKDFPELTAYNGVMFELSELNKHFDPKLFDVLWEDAVLSESKIKSNYNLKLSVADTFFSFIVNPVFEGSSYEKALKEYGIKFKSYKEQLALRNTNDALNRENGITNSTLPTRNSFNPDNKTTKDVTRVFEATRFGVWNCDKLRDLPNGEEVTGIYSDSEGNLLDLASLFFVDKSKNALFNITQMKRWRFNPHSENLLWGVTKTNRIAVFSPSQFRKIQRKDGNCHFTMSISDNVSAIKEIKKFLGI